ncbi:MAG: cadmium-translocating P-type ATPase [Bacteroidales bacterium]|nr:cadmium-translocating P-type ATPase [Bacteroidales bacterium]
MNKTMLRIVVTTLLLVVAVVVERNFSLPVWQLLLVYIVPYLLISYDILAETAEDIAHGEPFSEDLLMTVATMGALLIGFLPQAETQFPEAVFIMLLFQIGEMFEDYAEDKNRQSISHLMNIRPDFATVVRNGVEQTVAPELVAVGELVVIKAGEKVPMDGVVERGASSLNTVALTGESLPRDVVVGDEVLSGSINLSGTLTVRVAKAYADSTVSKILNLVENAQEQKSKSETFITRFARIYTPVVVSAAVVVAFVPPLLSGHFSTTFATWLYRALMFLIVSCPCALVVSVPLAFFGGIGKASRHGILVKGSNYMDVLSRLDTVVFDKTGTLTHGRFEVVSVHPNDVSADELLHLASHVEHYSTHPIAMSLKNAFTRECATCTVSDTEEVAGQGIRATVNGNTVCVGNVRMMAALGVECAGGHHHGTAVHVSINGRYAGYVVVSDKVKDDAAPALAELKQLGVRRTVMLTGDHSTVANAVARQLSIDEWHSEQLPADKVEYLQQCIASRKDSKYVAFVGDGINDAPVLALADVGIAMGALGSDAAIEAADVVVMDDNLGKIPMVMCIARQTVRIATQNVWFAITVKLLVLMLAFWGVAYLWMAVLADVGVTVLAVLNAMRLLKK